MDPTVFIWSALASLAATVVYSTLPYIARALVRLRASLLTPGRDADRMREEWSAALWELRSRHLQFCFALMLFRHFQKLQSEIESRADGSLDIDSLVEQRLQQQIKVLRMQLAAETKREEMERLRREFEGLYRAREQELQRKQQAAEQELQRKQQDAEREVERKRQYAEKQYRVWSGNWICVK